MKIYILDNGYLESDDNLLVNFITCTTALNEPPIHKWIKVPVESRQKKIPAIFERIERLMKYDTADDPISGLKWTRKTTGKIAAELRSVHIDVSEKPLPGY